MNISKMYLFNFLDYRLSRSLTIETSPRNSVSDTEVSVRVIHPDGTVSIFDYIPRGTIEVSRGLADGDKVPRSSENSD